MYYRRAIRLFGFLAAIWGLMLVSSTSVLANSPPQAPIIYSPTNGSYDVSPIPLLDWTGSDPDNDVLTYDVYLGLTADDAALVASNISQSSYQASPLFGQTRYYWFVVARDPSGAEATSVLATFVTANLTPPPPPPPGPTINPPDKSTGQPWTITFDWSQWDDGSGVQYFLYLGTTNPPSFWGTFTTATPTIDVSVYTQYYWSVTSRNRFGVDRYSPVWRFTSKADHPTQLTLATPVDNSFNHPFNVLLDWSAFDADGDALLFDVYLGVTIPPIKIASDVSLSSFTASAPTPLTRYYWQVVAKTMHGDTAGPIWSFTTKANALPGEAFNPTPPDGGATSNAVLTWQATDADLPAQSLTYDVYFGMDAQPPLVAWGLAAPSYTLSGLLLTGATYYWSVTVSDGINVTFGPTWSFVATDSIITGVGDAPSALTLGRNHPNPFNPQTIIPYTVPVGAPMHVRIAIFDITGRPVRVLVDETRSGGAGEVIWHGDNEAGAIVSSGIYYCVMDAGGKRFTRKLVLLK